MLHNVSDWPKRMVVGEVVVQVILGFGHRNRKFLGELPHVFRCAVFGHFGPDHEHRVARFREPLRGFFDDVPLRAGPMARPGQIDVVNRRFDFRGLIGL